MKAIGYVRVSTQEQTESGLSLDSQRRKIEAFCEAKDWRLTEIVSDPGLSGGNMQRPGLQDVLRKVKKREVDVVVVLKLDRLTRSVKDLCTLLEGFDKAGVAFSSVSDNFDTSTANGRLVLNILGSVNQWERDVISERTRDALAEKKAQHRRSAGEIPFGFTIAHDSDFLLPVDRQLETVGRIAEWRRSGESLNAIARKLNALGVATKKGGRWAAQTIKVIVRNSLYSDFVPGFASEGVR